MAKEKAPAFQFYPRDWQTDEHVRQMNLAERGFYVELLGYSWTEGSIPDDVDACTKLVGAPPILCPHCQTSIGAEHHWPSVRARFRPAKNGRLKQKRLETQRAAQKRHHRAKSAAGEKGAGKRWRGKKIDGSAIALPMANDSSSSSVPASTPGETGNSFELFWEKYPRKTGKAMAVQMWLSLDLDAIADQVMAGLDRWLRSAEWEKENGKYIPAPAKWLSEKRWLDDPKRADGDLPEYWR